MEVVPDAETIADQTEFPAEGVVGPGDEESMALTGSTETTGSKLPAEIEAKLDQPLPR